MTEHDSSLDLQDGYRPAGEGRELHDAEVRARRALGLSATDAPQRRGADTSSRQTSMERGGMDRQRRRFVHDGEVPVVVLSGSNNSPTASSGNPTNRLAVAEAALESERAARRQAERALGEAQATVHDLQTKIGHAHLARDEATDTVQRLKGEIAGLEELLASERHARGEAEQALHLANRARNSVYRGVPTTEARDGAQPLRMRTPSAGRPRKGEKEPKPVKWW